MAAQLLDEIRHTHTSQGPTRAEIVLFIVHFIVYFIYIYFYLFIIVIYFSLLFNMWFCDFKCVALGFFVCSINKHGSDTDYFCLIQ